MVLLHMALNINLHVFLDIQMILYCKKKYCVTLEHICDFVFVRSFIKSYLSSRSGMWFLSKINLPESLPH